MSSATVIAPEPPRDLEAESTVLATVMLWPEYLGEAELAAEDFATPEHRRLWALIAELDADGTPLDMVIVRRACLERGWTREAQVVLEMTDIAPDSPRFAHYARRIADRAQRRRLLDASRRIADLAADRAEDVQAVTARAMDFLAGIAGKSLADRERTFAQLYAGKLRLLDAREKREAFETGFTELWPRGMGRGILSVIGARPSMGKTAFALNLAANLVYHNPEARVLLVSQEMTFELLEDRVFSMVSGTSLTRNADTTIEPSRTELEAWADGRARVNDWGARVVVMQDRVTAQFLRARARALKRARGLDVVIVDYLQLLSGGKGEKRYLQVGDLSAHLLDLAREERLAVVALSQLNREAEHREPSMGDLRESGNIEQDARNIFLLDRPFLRQDALPDGGLARECDLVVKVGKFSEGQAFGRVRLHYQLESQRIEGWPGSGCRKCNGQNGQNVI